MKQVPNTKTEKSDMFSYLCETVLERPDLTNAQLPV